MASWACRLVPTNIMRPPLATTCDSLQRAEQTGTVSRQVEDVDQVAGAEDILAHLRVPPAGPVAEMDASFQELAHGVVG